MRIISLIMGAALALSAGVALSLQVTRPPSTSVAAVESPPAAAPPPVTVAQADAPSVMPARRVHTVPIVEPKAAPEPEPAPAAGLGGAGLRPTIQEEARSEDESARTPDRGAVSEAASEAPAPALAPASHAERSSAPLPNVSAVASAERISPPPARKMSRASRRFHAQRRHGREPRVAANPPPAAAGTASVQSASSPPATAAPHWRTLSEFFGR